MDPDSKAVDNSHIMQWKQSPRLAWQGFANAVELDLGVALPLEHSFACERDVQKREWIKEMFPNAVIFCDLLDLANEEAATHQGTARAVPSDWATVVGGFPCTTASSLNPKSWSMRNRTCIENMTD